jgi:hypothetical protein
MAGYQRDYDDRCIHMGTCPRCGCVVMYARETGLLTVVEAVPTEDEIGCLVTGRLTYSVSNNHLKLRTAAWRAYSPDSTAHPEHTACDGPGGRTPTPRPIRRPPPPPSDPNEKPPFDLKPWRCWVCDTLIQPEEQGMVIQYDGPEMSYYSCRCAADCTPKERTQITLGEKKPRYARVDRFGNRMEPKKGEVGFSD